MSVAEAEVLQPALMPRAERTGLGEGTVRIEELQLGPSPRLNGEDEDHVRALAEVDAPLPPILVHRTTMQVIDGTHRLRAARLKGESEIAVRYFDGSADDAFVEAVRANVSHGKPLTLAEREAAARRILGVQPHWSDRATAHACALSSKTVAGLRRSLGESAQPSVRVGKDGRLRPLDTDSARERAAELFRERPDASLREVAAEAGISPATVRDVKLRMRNGIGPRLRPPTARITAERATAPVDVDGLSTDSALQSTESNRALSQWLAGHMVEIDDWKPFLDDIPMSRVYVLADAARRCANVWLALAQALEERSKRPGR